MITGRNLAAALLAAAGIALLAAAAFDWVGYTGFSVSLLAR
jgi:hypothetical protein